MGSEIAPLFYHEDSYDLNNDGYDDIIIAADNDPVGGYNAGAFYVIDGLKMTSNMQ